MANETQQQEVIQPDECWKNDGVDGKVEDGRVYAVYGTEGAPLPSPWAACGEGLRAPSRMLTAPRARYWKDQRRKLIDAFEIQNLLTGLSGTVTRLFSRALSWSPDYVAYARKRAGPGTLGGLDAHNQRLTQCLRRLERRMGFSGSILALFRSVIEYLATMILNTPC
ncbi:uncharacterized protein THITE_113152 [Thermothielavioides terrestris NRRL 8126]|uniref:Uncharacterized protein n=1 Tax=Thermothielavioides terrestris (strain ATCC 38088 / NRRL 8126) TaxID=578455 RepID=G2QSK9_THETT|nr:uncharacterized protein THITE_113152 [Thermothielavioides terrestris NRRL 8126]AEO63491.1 hypothetical protein THITE_113152 [Thermothielavioides terrestris NRRL 8126]